MTAQIVPSGSFAVVHGNDNVLVACLGTCVGIALFDSSAGVGGLLHLLLPKPGDPEDPYWPEAYASTAIPMFIRALVNAGAHLEHLKASVAGGCLMEPISRQDVILDIGGRTAEVALGLLSNYDIPVVTGETGGTFGCRFFLDPRTWETRIEPLEGAPCQDAGGSHDKPGPEDLNRVIDGLGAVPQIVLKAIRIIESDAFSVSELKKEIVRDQVLCAKIIGLCNTVYFRSPRKVDSIERALLVLGSKYIVQALLTAFVDRLFAGDANGYSLCKGGLYRHAVLTAVASRAVAEISGKANRDLAYTGGLLHDIGKIVLDQSVAASHPLFYCRAMEGGAALVAREQEMFGCDHTETGGLLATKWGLPSELSEVIRGHHRSSPSKSSLLNVVRIADAIVSHFMVGIELEQLGSASVSTGLRALGIEPSQFPALLEKILPELQKCEFAA
jgi:putative nucleotidyltransferase with HDIG domain